MMFVGDSVFIKETVRDSVLRTHGFVRQVLRDLTCLFRCDTIRTLHFKSPLVNDDT
jgi:hypothetical protein